METYVRARIDTDLKDAATAVLKDCGLTVSAAFRIFLSEVVATKAMPIEIKAHTPNARLRVAIEEADALATGKPEHFNSVESMMESLKVGKKTTIESQDQGKSSKGGASTGD